MTRPRPRWDDQAWQRIGLALARHWSNHTRIVPFAAAFLTYIDTSSHRSLRIEQWDKQAAAAALAEAVEAGWSLAQLRDLLTSIAQHPVTLGPDLDFPSDPGLSRYFYHDAVDVVRIVATAATGALRGTRDAAADRADVADPVAPMDQADTVAPAATQDAIPDAARWVQAVARWVPDHAALDVLADPVREYGLGQFDLSLEAFVRDWRSTGRSTDLAVAAFQAGLTPAEAATLATDDMAALRLLGAMTGQ